MDLLWDKLTKLISRSLHIGARLFLVFAVLSASLGVVVILAAKPGWAAEQKVVHLQLFGGIIHIHEGNHLTHNSHKTGEVRYSNPTPGVVEQVSEIPNSQPLISYEPGQQISEFSSGSSLNWLQLFSPKSTGTDGEALFGLARNFQRVLPPAASLPRQPYLELPLRPPQF